MLHITEKCACGAEFSVRDSYTTGAMETVREWRDNHRHDEKCDMPDGWEGTDD